MNVSSDCNVCASLLCLYVTDNVLYCKKGKGLFGEGYDTEACKSCSKTKSQEGGVSWAIHLVQKVGLYTWYKMRKNKENRRHMQFCCTKAKTM